MDSILESFRLLLEERERLLDDSVQELLYAKKNHQDEINSGHRFISHLDRYMKISQKLCEMYQDKDGLMAEETAAISGGNEFAEFYGRIRNSKEFHRKFPNVFDTLASEFENLKKAREKHSDDATLVTFTDEESYGRFLDLHGFYHQFMNMEYVKENKRLSSLTYLEYLGFVERLHELSFEAKNTENFEKYIKDLKDYLYSFITRAKPLLDIKSEISDNLKQFDVQWSCGDFPGWETVLLNVLLQQSSNNPQVFQLIDLNSYNSAKDLELLGLDKLKDILQKLGLKCGGTLQDRASRLYALKNCSLEKLDKSHFPTKKRKNIDGLALNIKDSYKTLEEYKKLAYQEAHIYLFFDILREELEATKDNIERKQARTVEEMMQEEEGPEPDDNFVSDDDEDFQDKTLYNPKNLPLDFDGKPIPYWLYKLHGLNIYYNCEICGNTKYRGPKAFQRHFGEWRHAHGMRCLGIPNTAHFVNVTKIQDAYNLWDTIKNSKQKEQWNPDFDEEFEDTDGNPINKKIFDDMKRQGLL